MSDVVAKETRKAPVRALASLLIAALLVAGIFAGTVSRADNGLEMSTAFPGVTVKAGENVSFDLTLENTTAAPLDAALSVTSMPDGWDGYFEGSGDQVSAVHVSGAEAEGETPPDLTFSLTVPADAEDGTYRVSLLADAGAGVADAVDLSLVVSQTERSQGQFTSQYPELQGPSTATFSFSVNLTNNSGADQSYSLSANPPEGWQVSFKPTGETNQIASVTVGAAKSQGLDVTVTPPATVVAGEYDIPLSAVSAEETLTTDLKVIITGTYAMTVSTPSGLLTVDGYADRETPVTLSVTNDGTADLENVALSSTAPENWAVRFDVSTIDLLPVGTTQEVTAYIKPGPNVIAGDYITILTATAKEATAQADFRVAVKTSTVWGVTGVIIIAVIVIVLALVFRKFGRR